MSILGNRVVRIEDPRLLTEGGTYVDDVAHPLLDGAAYVAYVRSPIAHGEIVAIETDEARRLPGVVGVFTAGDLGLTPNPNPFNPGISTAPLAVDRVRYVGEPVAVVVAETRAEATDAAESVWVEADPLPAVIGIECALDGETLLYPDLGSNVVVDGAWMGIPPLTADQFEGCEVLVSARLVNQRLAPCPLEVRAAAAAWGPDGRLHHWATSQVPGMLRNVLGQLYGGADKIHVIVPDMGGGFGPKSGMYSEELMLGGLAAALGRPMRWVETRTESMVGLAHGRAQVHDITIGGRRDGRVLAYRLEVVQDAGAVPNFAAVLPVMMTVPMATGVYDIAKVEGRARSVVTNTTPVAAYRGAGRPEATAAIERAMDLFAAEVGLDPVEVRRRNLFAPFAEPFDTVGGMRYDCGDYGSALDAALDRACYSDLRAEQAVRRQRGDRMMLGIGVSCYVEITGASPPGLEPGEAARVTVDGGSGSITVYTGTLPHGQGHDTSWAMIAGDCLGVPIESVTVVHGDSDLVPFGAGTFGSRSLQHGGAAVQRASVALVERATSLAAELLEAAPADVVVDEGRIHVAGSPSAGFTWAELAERAAAVGAPLDIQMRSLDNGPTFPFGAHVAVVEVDRETGAVRLLRMIACDDAGTLLNPMLAEGQVHGGLAQGIAQALLEEVVYDGDGNPRTANLADYACISATELPMFETVEHVTPTPHNALGAKGIGESGTVGATPAVQSAVIDAAAHLGVRHIDLPLTPERVWRALNST